MTLVPSSSVQALEPTGALTVIAAGSDFPCCDPTADPAVSCAAVSAAAAAVAADSGAACAGDPPGGPEVAVAAFGSVARLWPSRESSAFVVLLAAAKRLSCAEVPLADAVDVEDVVVDVADVADVADVVDAAAEADVADAVDAAAAVGVGTAATAPANAPLSAFSRSARALDTGSASECLPEASLDASVEDLLPFVGAALVDTAPSAGGVASDWANAAEKPSSPVPD